MKDLHDTIMQAERLLQYASTKGMAVPAELISEIVDAKQLLAKDDKDPETSEQQKKFWQALAKLTEITKPATIESIGFATATQSGLIGRLCERWLNVSPRQVGVGELAVNRAGTIALLTLLIVGFLQLYADIGGTTVQEYQANQQTYVSNWQKLEPNQTASLNQEQAALLKSANAMLLDKTERQLEIMTTWLFWMTFKGETDSPEYAQHVLAATEGILGVLRGFLLPVGWGFLGAALYVSRSLAEDIRTMAYARDQQTLHRSRYYMGAVAGFVVAKFSIALSGKPVDDVVHPFVLALLVGYSVEVLFNLLDKLIATFSSK